MKRIKNKICNRNLTTIHVHYRTVVLRYFLRSMGKRYTIRKIVKMQLLVQVVVVTVYIIHRYSSVFDYTFDHVSVCRRRGTRNRWFVEERIHNYNNGRRRAMLSRGT